jgi:hypothetical protein
MNELEQELFVVFICGPLLFALTRAIFWRKPMSYFKGKLAFLFGLAWLFYVGYLASYLDGAFHWNLFDTLFPPPPGLIRK